MAKRDWLRECNDQNVPPQEFGQIFCVRCRNPDCTRAGYAGSLFNDRVSTQVERLLLNPNFADLSLPQYAKIHNNDFPDAIRQALRIEIANKRKDWTAPSEEEIDVSQAQQELTNQPAKPKAPESRLKVDVVELPDEDDGFQIVEDPDDTDETPVIAQPAPVVQAQPAPSAVQVQVQNKPANTAHPIGGVMLGPAAALPQSKIVVDPWAAPVPSKDVVVPVGAKIRMGLAKADEGVKK